MMFSLFTESSPSVFIGLTVIIGGGAAFLAGRALALKWRPLWQLVIYMLLLAAAVRFLHYALFGETLLSFRSYLSDAVVLIAAAFLGFRLTRVKQMTTQYFWLYEKAGPFAWRERGNS
ncbi:MAG TPA: hypothetical protein ENJ62_00370 [Bryobacterales bacterium]|nr:hypothetical protein [Bryobacterales bacterium]